MVPLFRPSPFQFARTRPLRLLVYREARLALRERILEVGAGEGAVAEEMAARTGKRVVALDLWPPASPPPGVCFVRGDGHHLPFLPKTFDAVAFHFVLLWLARPVAALREARRVLRPGGVLLLLAEPDLTRREDEPDTGLGWALLRAVEGAEGHGDAGTRAEGWLREAGFVSLLRWSEPTWISLGDPRETEAEVQALEEAGVLSVAEAHRIRAAEREASAVGSRRVRLPLVYGWARPR
ncbi:MAG: class I SAM-dependent methyltransferase [Acidobacteriota bacterium]